jgi:GH24 family phage-related lysozyme (muramidase)
MPRGNVTNKIRLLDLFQYYRHGMPHQMAAVTELEEAINRANPHILGRDQGWYKTWQHGGKQHDYSAGIALIKEFEGCHLEAYPDPLHGWDVATIGYGTTRYGDGRKVQRGDKITSVEADTLLRLEVDRIGKHLSGAIPHWGEMSDKQKGALLSFAYNVGAAFYGATGFATISRNLREKAWTEIPATLELYRNPGSSVEAGLLRRRRAEGKLWMEGMTSQQVQQQGFGNPLQVPFYQQLDSSTDQARRMCFSSSCAMLLEYLKPGTLKGPNGDDQYLRRVQQYGDTTDAKAQVRALSSYGIKARFVTNATFATLEQQIAKGVPTPCGYLHRGPVTAPAGGGHWLCVVGHTPDAVIVHDPLGEADLINGTTFNKSARFARYSRKNFGRRWEVEGPGTGWAILAER